MPENHVKFHSSNGKRLILIVEDEAINRAILTEILKEEYEFAYAETGKEAMDVIRSRFDALSLVLLDLNLPDINGMDILRWIKDDAQFSRIPVIVMTSDRESEVESLTVGAGDFISKPYPMPKVILARVRRSIELSEDRDIIRWTERDQLTGLYNRDYFYRYADQFDQHHKTMAMDAIVIDVNHFHLINERYGKAYADEILKRISTKVKELVAASGGIVCRRDADTFLIYCPHRNDYTSILEKTSVGLGGEGRSNVRLRMGVYSDVDKTIDIERRFDRAQMAADSVRSNFTKAIAIYDNELHEAEIFAEQLLEGFQDAIDKRQFLVYYQPKFDIRPSEPILNSAEALVRWRHPELGMISPGVFVPLFESHGLIQKLDNYVWREAASQIRDWKDRLGFSVPVSVNVSRVDMLDPDLVEKMESLMEEFGLSHSEFFLEITESAYTQDADHIISTVSRLRDSGFEIEMDDFGSGYSSLNMISTLPIDALKLDMMFIRNAFSDRRNTRMLEVVFDIADSLSVPTIAEGVETAEQLFTLKTMGCDIVQGYYFSRPLPAEDFESFIIERKQISVSAGESGKSRDGAGRSSHDRFTYDALHDSVTRFYNQSGFELLFHDADKGHIALLMAVVAGYRELPRETADQMIVRVADVLRQNFRSVDLICRLKEDEFVILMTRINSAMKNLIVEKVSQVNRELEKATDSLPGTFLMVGAALSDREAPEGSIIEDAEQALCRIMKQHSPGCEFF